MGGASRRLSSCPAPLLLLLLANITHLTSGRLPEGMYLVRSAPFLFKSEGLLTEPTAVLRSSTKATECECMSSCLIRDDCLSFSFDTVSGDCKLHAIRGSGPRTSHNSSVIYRFRSGIANLGDWCTSDSECQFTNGVASCSRGTCVCPTGKQPISWTECGDPPTTTTVTAATTSEATIPTTTEATSTTVETTSTTVETPSTTVETTSTTDLPTSSTAAPSSTSTLPTTVSSTTSTAAATESSTISSTTIGSTTTIISTTTTEDPCSGATQIEGVEGTILSPNYPDDYGNDVDIIWMIMAEPGQTIRININDFSLEEDDQSCTRYDFLEFRDGDSVDALSLGGKFCGSNYPKRVGPSTSNVMTVVFHTDIGRVARGFNLTWKLCGAGDQLGTCDASTDFSGTLQSVNYPAEYPSGRDTFWHFVATHPTRRFSITFTDFELESSYGTCSYDTLKISDPSGIEEGPFCGDTMPAPFGPTAGSQLTVNLYTDSSSQFRGFSADWTGTCNTGTSSSSTEEM